MSLRTIEHEGVVWNVWDVVPNASALLSHTRLMQTMEGGWLCFESESEKRRMIPIPPGWADWPDEELIACLDRAEPVRRRLPEGEGTSVPGEGAPDG